MLEERYREVEEQVAGLKLEIFKLCREAARSVQVVVVVALVAVMVVVVIGSGSHGCESWCIFLYVVSDVPCCVLVVLCSSKLLPNQCSKNTDDSFSVLFMLVLLCVVPQ